MGYGWRSCDCCFASWDCLSGSLRLVRRGRDHSGQALAGIYFEEEPGRQAARKLLTRDEARRIAANIAKLPGRVKRSYSTPAL